MGRDVVTTVRELSSGKILTSSRRLAPGGFTKSILSKGANNSGTALNSGFYMTNVSDFDFDYDQPRTYVFHALPVAWNWPSGQQTLLTKTDSSGKGLYLWIDHRGSVSAIFYSLFPTTIALRRTTSRGSFEFSCWSKIIITYDGSGTSTGYKIYVNGAESTYLVTGGNSTLAQTFDNQAAIYVNGAPPVLNRGLGGNFTNFGVFNRVLNQTEINNYQQQDIVPATPVAWFSSEDYTEGSSWVDTTGTYTAIDFGTPKVDTERLPSKDRAVVV